MSQSGLEISHRLERNITWNADESIYDNFLL